MLFMIKNNLTFLIICYQSSRSKDFLKNTSPFFTCKESNASVLSARFFNFVGFFCWDVPSWSFILYSQVFNCLLLNKLERRMTIERKRWVDRTQRWHNAASHVPSSHMRQHAQHWSIPLVLGMLRNRSTGNIFYVKMKI